MFEGIGIFDFVSRFKTDADCKKYLYELKWGKGLVCKRCGHTGWSKTKDSCVRKCNRCKHKESATCQVPSKGGKNFPLMHRQIMMLKAWLRGIHHHCEHLQYYLDEYCFQFNRNRNTRTIFHELISKMMNTKPVTYKNFQLLWGN